MSLTRKLGRLAIAALIWGAIWFLFIRPADSHHASLLGTATWYDDGPGLYAAAGPGLRHGDWRGDRVEVCTKQACVTVKLTDWCQCYKDTDHERLIDLSPAAFRRLAALSRGVVRVAVSPVDPAPVRSTMRPTLARTMPVAS